MRRILLTAVIIAAAVARASAQRTIEGQAHGLAALASRPFVGGGLGLAVRPAPRLRFALSTTAGDWEGEFAARAELLGTFHPSAARRSGVAVYGGAGIAAVIERPGMTEYLVLLFGLESAPAARKGWFLEAGAGGGVRLSAGLRFGRPRVVR